MHLCITMDQFYDDVTYPKSARTHFRAILCLLRPRWTPLQLGKNNKNRIAQEKKNTRKVKYKSSQFNALSGCVCARTYIVCLIIILPPKKWACTFFVFSLIFITNSLCVQYVEEFLIQHTIEGRSGGVHARRDLLYTHSHGGVGIEKRRQSATHTPVHLIFRPPRVEIAFALRCVNVLKVSVVFWEYNTH